MARNRSTYVLMVVLAVVLAACGGDGSTDTTEAPATTTTAPDGGATTVDSGEATTTTAGSAAPETLEEILAYTGDDAEEIFYACAQEEGKVVYYTSSSAAERLAKPAFEAAYPGVTLEVFRGTNELVQRLVEEETAGQHNFDVYGDIHGNLARDDEFFAAFDSPGRENLRDSVNDPYYVGTRGFVMSVAYNPDLVAPDEVPTQWSDLLDPAWEGEVWLGSDTSTPVVLGMLKQTFGDEFLEALAANVRVQEVSSRGIADQIISGEIALGMNVSSSYHKTDYLNDGAPFRWTPMPPNVAFFSTDSISKNAPHPCAARLFIDWLLDDEGGQAVYLEAGNASPKEGASILPFEVEGVPDPSEWEFVFNTDPALIAGYADYQEAVADWENIFRTQFVRG